MAMPEIDEVKDAALKYDKKALAKMVQMGQMSNTTAMMAAMMRDRIVQSEMKPPAPPTVADEVFQPAQGLAAVPTDPRMFQGMASGGIVAMAGGGDVQRFQNTGFVSSRPLTATLNPEYAAPPPTEEELREYERLKNLGLLDAISETYMPLVRKVQNFFTRGTGAQGSTYRSDIAPPVAKPTFGPDIAKAEAAMAAQAAAIQSGAGAANRADPKFLAAGQEKAVAYAPTSVAAPEPQAKPPEKGLGATKEAQDFAALRSAQADVEKTLKDQMGDKPTIQGTIESGRAFDKEHGVDRDFFKKQAADLIAQRDELKGDRKEAANMRLLEAGLSILGGTSPYAFENIGKGASKALAGFADDIKDIKRQTRELEKARQDVLRAEQVAARSDSAKAQDRFEKRSDEYKKMQLKMAETRAEFATKYEELGLRKEALKVQREQANRTPAEIQLIERYNSDPKFAAAFDKMQTARQAPKTEAALRKEYTENYALLKKDFPTVQDYIDSQMGGSAVPGVKFMGVR